MNTENEIKQIVTCVNNYLEARTEKEPMQILNEHIRELRICLQHAITHIVLPLTLDKAREFRLALADQLSTLCDERRGNVGSGEHHHYDYCLHQIISCFEWTEQIKEEVPDDPITQQILAVDIPILRPFDYGLGKLVEKD